MANATNAQVAQAFANSVPACNQSGTFRTDGNNLFSYATQIGSTLDWGVKVISESRMSPTTGKQLNLVRRELGLHISTNVFEYGVGQHEPTADEICESLIGEMQDLVEQSNRARTNGLYLMEQAQHKAQQALDLITRYEVCLDLRSLVSLYAV